MVSKYNLILRKVTKSDEDLLFNWANDSDVRKWSFSKHFIKLDEHAKWFKKKYNDPNVLMWIFEVNNDPEGLVRLEKENNKVLLNYLIAPQSRGKRLATKMLKIAMNEVRIHWHNIKVFAYTLPENIASIKSLEKAGFLLENSNNTKKCYVFHEPKKVGVTKR